MSTTKMKKRTNADNECLQNMFYDAFADGVHPLEIALQHNTTVALVTKHLVCFLQTDLGSLYQAPKYDFIKIGSQLKKLPLFKDLESEYVRIEKTDNGFLITPFKMPSAQEKKNV